MTANRPLRILHVTSVGKTAYGVATYVLNLARAQQDAGHDVHFTTWEDRPFTQELRDLGHSVHPILVRAKYDHRAVKQLASIAESLNIDVMHAHLSTSCIIAAFAGRRAKVPSFGHIHGLSSKWSFIFNTQVIASAEAARQHLIRQGMRAEKVSTALNGLRPLSNLPSPETARSDLGLSECFPIYSSSCRLTKLKGIDAAIQATARLKSQFPNIRYLACGDGSELEEMKALARELGVDENVIFPGYIPESQLHQVLRASHFYVFPSLKETIPMAILEAMSAELPVISTTVGGVPELVKPETGVLVPPSDVDSLTQAIQTMALDSSGRGRMGAAGRKLQVEEFSDAQMAQRIDSIYRSKIRA